ncbi:MAG: carboxypeptidase-like regulatory domain-containing protein, partial [Acidobacteria bacterium]|nr:carboxypeptidase-like regulatory domain-containing protein [Acidobacteriota bacterium]
MFKKSSLAACIIALLSFALLSATAFGQGTSATLSGSVQDASGGAVVGATITARNLDTGIETRATTNNAGVYNLSLQAGNYVVYADFAGFQRTTREGVRLTAGSQTNLPLPMAVQGQVTEIEVTGTVESMVLEASASTGTLLQETVIQSIPTLTPNAIEATLNVMGGVTRMTSGSTVFSAAGQEVAGISSSMINVTRDGITVNEVRNPTGIAAASNINPEVVGEMRVIQSAVDAELGRGAGQIQVTTRSGSNTFHGSGVWNIQNTALDAVDFSVKSRKLEANWRNVNNYTATVSGPIIKNRTFFFASWEQQIARDKMIQIPRVMTSCARRGIYRWLATPDSDSPTGWRGWVPNTISPTNTYNTSQGNLRGVEDDGTPFKGGEIRGSGGPMTIAPTTVMFESVFGQLRSDIRTALEDRNNPLGVYGNGVDGCTMMDQLGYDPMNSKFLTTTDGQNVNSWTGDFASGGAYRYAYDPTGFADRFALTGADYGPSQVIMPPANYYMGHGDGLNSAGHKWTTLMVGQGSSNYGTGGDPDRKAFATRIDHNINSNHRLSGTFNWENFYVWDAYRVWPESFGGYHGDITRKPWSIALSLNSTLAPTVLNEFRFGASRSNTWVYKALDSAKNGENMAAVLQALSGNDASNPYYAGSWAQDQRLLIGLGDAEGGAVRTADSLSSTAYRNDINPVMGETDNVNRSHPYGTRGNMQATWGGYDPRWTFGDTVTWIKGTHSFKGGFEYRRQSSYQAVQGTTTSFVRGGGNTNLFAVRGGLSGGGWSNSGSGINGPVDQRRRGSLARAAAAERGWQNVYSGSQDIATAAASGNYAHAYNLMTFFSGSVSDASLMFYAIPDPKSPTGARWNDFEAGEQEYAYDISNQEFSWFFKDDWKVTSNLTLNLGVRWEYYGVPHASDGRTLGIRGGSQNAWGITTPGDFYNNGKGWVVDRDYLPGFQRDANLKPILPEPAIVYEFIGPESPNPGRSAWNKDTNNFAPHVGFAWQLPWFGRGLTTLRGGYSVSYGQIDNFNSFPGQFVNVAAAGTSYTETYTGVGDRLNPGSTAYYMDLTDLKNILPLRPSAAVLPLGVQQNDALYTAASTAIDENLTNPYVHSLNVSLTRSIGRVFTVDLRYIGTFRRNEIASLNVNQNPFLDTTLFNWIKELDKVRAGGESMYINSIIPHNTGEQRYYSNVPDQTGSAQLRQQAAGNLARGVYNTLVSGLRTENGQLPVVYGTERGMLLRSGCLPKDRPGYETAFTANNSVDVNNFPCTVGLPLNFGHTAPQYDNSSIRHNTNAVNNYNSMQAQVTMRPAYGLNFQATYTWSRNLNNSGWSNYLGERDYILSGQHRTHQLRFFGTYELPFGAKGFLLRDASGPVKKAVEGWGLSWILSMESGPPLSVTAATTGSTLWGRNWPILVRPDLWDDKQGKARMEWGPNGEFIPGTYLDKDYVWVIDGNICNENRMTATLYTTQCGPITAPRALALATRNASGALVAAKYDSDFTADDGITYKAGDDIIVFRNADQSDGREASGNYKPNRMTAQGRFSFDLAMSKSIEFMEGKRFEVRVDALNILNHATPIGPEAPSAMESGGRYVSIDSPGLAITATGAVPFGSLNNKVG